MDDGFKYTSCQHHQHVTTPPTSNVALVSQHMHPCTLEADESPGQASLERDTVEKEDSSFVRVDAKNTEQPHTSQVQTYSAFIAIMFMIIVSVVISSRPENTIRRLQHH